MKRLKRLTEYWAEVEDDQNKYRPYSVEPLTVERAQRVATEEKRKADRDAAWSGIAELRADVSKVEAFIRQHGPACLPTVAETLTNLLADLESNYQNQETHQHG